MTMTLETTERYYQVSRADELSSDDGQLMTPTMVRVRWENREWVSALVYGIVPEDGTGAMATYYRGAAGPVPDFVRPLLRFFRLNAT